MNLCIIWLDAEGKQTEESTAVPTTETTAEARAESTIEAVVGNTSATIVDANAAAEVTVVESSAIPVLPPVTTVVAAPVENILIWPSMQDLNTRLRRVITSYQRNYKKEELKQQQKAKVNLSYHFVHIQYIKYRDTPIYLFMKHSVEVLIN